MTYYTKVKGKYKRVRGHEFPATPADGYWIVEKQGTSKARICRVEDLQHYDKKVIKHIAQRLNALCVTINILRFQSWSSYEIARAIMHVLSLKAGADISVYGLYSREIPDAQ
jgi:hypothetical protein